MATKLAQAVLGGERRQPAERPLSDISGHAPLISGILMKREPAEKIKGALLAALKKVDLTAEIVSEQRAGDRTIFTVRVNDKERRIPIDDTVAAAANPTEEINKALKLYRVTQSQE